MIVYKENEYNFLERENGKYKMYINGWYAGGLLKREVKTDTQAIEIYKRIKKFEMED